MAQDWKNTVGVVAPHVLILVMLILYVLGGAIIFRALDDKLAKDPMTEVILFTFTTITTIGYGNIVPKTTKAQLFCILFSAFGIPLNFLALANVGKFFTEGYWIITDLVSKKKMAHTQETADRRLPLFVCLMLLLSYVLFGGMLFHFWEDRLSPVDAVYFSFISFTTIGFGDICPTAGSVGHTMFIIGYLALGIVIVSTFVSALSVYLHKIHYLGRSFTGAGEVDVWFGGQSLTVSELILLVADQFGVSPEELQSVLHDLDDIIDAVCDNTQPKTPPPETINNNTLPKLMLRRSSSSEEHSLLNGGYNEPLSLVIRRDEKSLSRPDLMRGTSSNTMSPKRDMQFDYSSMNAHTLPASRADLFKALGMVYNITHSASSGTSSPTRRNAPFQV